MIGPLREALGAAVGPEHVGAPAPLDDVAGRPCGPFLRVRPASTAEVAAVVRACRPTRTPLVPLGAATAYWAPLPGLGDTPIVGIDLARLDAVTVAGRAPVVGAGAAVRPLDQTLRGRGLHLPIHPDAFGHTSVGALVASACTSGIGMGLGSIGEAVAGVEVVTGTGEVFWTGSAARAGVPPFLREGFPDLTGAILGAEGGLGVVTHVALRPRPAPWRVHLRGAVPPERLGAVVAHGAALGGAYDTFRLARTLGAWEAGYALDVWVISAFSAREAVERAVEVQRRLAAAGARIDACTAESAAARAGRSPDYDARWNGPIDGLDPFLARARLRGLDVNAPYEAFPALLAEAEALLAAQREAGVPESRLAWYLAPDFLNLGVHATVPKDADPWPEARSAPWFARFAALPIVPYRLGRAWPPAMLDGLGLTRALLHDLRRALDPDRLFVPGHPLWT